VRGALDVVALNQQHLHMRARMQLMVVGVVVALMVLTACCTPCGSPCGLQPPSCVGWLDVAGVTPPVPAWLPAERPTAPLASTAMQY
jgi:hypothetical protein